MRLVWKDHKVYQTIPPTRPICSVTIGPLVRSAEVLSLIINSALNCDMTEEECRSSEEMQRAIMDANSRIKEEKMTNIMVFSMNVDALFPSMNLEDVLDTIRELFLDTDLQVKVEDDKLLAQYLTVLVSKEELAERGLAGVIPRRTVEEGGR